jgi:hypothetical protein
VTHALANIAFLVVLAVAAGVLIAELEFRGDSILNALRGRR